MFISLAETPLGHKNNRTEVIVGGKTGWVSSQYIKKNNIKKTVLFFIIASISMGYCNRSDTTKKRQQTENVVNEPSKLNEFSPIQDSAINCPGTASKRVIVFQKYISTNKKNIDPDSHFSIIIIKNSDTISNLIITKNTFKIQDTVFLKEAVLKKSFL